jgi:hypothetical protein
VPAGTNSNARVIVNWSEAGLGARTFEFTAYVNRPADVPTNSVIALFDNNFLTPDAAVNGVLGRLEGGIGRNAQYGCDDGTYGSLASPATVMTNGGSFALVSDNPVVTLTITNQTVADITLSDFHFDVGRRWINSPEAFTLSVSGDVTDTPALLVASNLNQVAADVSDYDDFDVDLTGLADHTLAAGESLTFTFTFVTKDGYYITSLDNLALAGTFDAYGGWASFEGLTVANNLPGDNPDGDGKINLLEFSSGGDPLVADGAASESWVEEDGGTSWLYFVHLERQDDPSLKYGDVGTKTDLLADPTWDTNDVELIGGPSGAGLFKTVTNRTEAAGTTKFIGVPIEKD